MRKLLSLAAIASAAFAVNQPLLHGTLKLCGAHKHAIAGFRCVR